MTTTLYRAASRSTICPATFGRGACFSPERETAEAYTDNPGFGGAHLFRFEVASDFVLEVTGLRALADEILAAATKEERTELLEEYGLSDFCTLSTSELEDVALEDVPVADDDELARELAMSWQSAGYDEVFAVLENCACISEIVQAHWDWIVYPEAGVGEDLMHDVTTTWRYYGARPLLGRPVF